MGTSSSAGRQARIEGRSGDRIRRGTILAATGIIAVGASVATASPAAAGTAPTVFSTEVTSLATGDDGTSLITLDEALENADSNPGPDTITFVDALFADDALVGEPEIITLETEFVDGDITIEGPGEDKLVVAAAVAVDEPEFAGSSSGRLEFHGDGDVTIKDLTLDGGLLVVGDGDGVPFIPVESTPMDTLLERVTIDVGYSSGISFFFTEGDVTIIDSTFSGDFNLTTLSSFDRNATSVGATNVDDVDVSGSTFAGVGLDVDGADSLTVTNSTISESIAGAVTFDDVNGDVTISDSTIFDNSNDDFDGPIIGNPVPVLTCAALCASADPGDTPSETGHTLLIENSTITENDQSPEAPLIHHSVVDPYEITASLDDESLATVVLSGTTIAGNNSAPVICFDPCDLAVDTFSSRSSIVYADVLQGDLLILTDNGSSEPFGVSMGPDLVRDEPSLAESPFASNIVSVVLPDDSEFDDEAKSFGEAGVINGVFVGNAVFTDDPQLGDLADNGGATLTMLPAPSSLAVDLGSFGPDLDGDDVLTASVDSEEAGALDQRGEERGRGNGNDAGAVEVQPDTFTFSVASTVAESDGSLTITLVRTGDGIGEASINVETDQLLVSAAQATADATPGTDYTALDTQVEWADGDTDDKQVTLTVLADEEIEGNEQVEIRFSDPENLELDESNESTVVTITDSTIATTTTTTTTVPETTTTTTTTTVPETTTSTTAATTTTVATTVVATTTPQAPPTVTPQAPAGLVPGGQSSFIVEVEHESDQDPEVTATSSDPSKLQVVSVKKVGSGPGAALMIGIGEATTATSYEVTVRALAGSSGNVDVVITAIDNIGTSTSSVSVAVSNAVLPSTGSDGMQRTLGFAAVLLAFGAMTVLFTRRRGLSTTMHS